MNRPARYVRFWGLVLHVSAALFIASQLVLLALNLWILLR